MHRYLNQSEYTKLILDKRKAIVIPDVHTKDLDEYIGNIMVYLNNAGINTSIFNIPKVIKNKMKNCYAVLLIVRSKYTDIEEAQFIKALQSINNVKPESYQLGTQHKNI